MNNFKDLIRYFRKLPGIGPRQATRLVLAMLEWPEGEAEAFAQAIANLPSSAQFCSECFNLAETPSTNSTSSGQTGSGQAKCRICLSSTRNKAKIAVVEKVTDLQALDKSGSYDGVYHVLGNSLKPAYGVTPEKLKIKELVARITSLKRQETSDKRQGKSKIEVILATNPDTHGETTALYLEDQLKSLGVQITRLARGLSSGSSVEYADDITLANALKHRK